MVIYITVSIYTKLLNHKTHIMVHVVCPFMNWIKLNWFLRKCSTIESSREIQYIRIGPPFKQVVYMLDVVLVQNDKFQSKFYKKCLLICMKLYSAKSTSKHILSEFEKYRDRRGCIHTNEVFHTWSTTIHSAIFLKRICGIYSHADENAFIIFTLMHDFAVVKLA